MKPNCATIDQRHTPAPTEDTKDCIFFHDTHVGQQAQLESACYSVARDGSNNRLFHLQTRRSHRSSVPISYSRHLKWSLTSSLSDCMKIRSCTKSAVCTMEDTDLLACVIFKGKKCFVECLRCLGVNGIPAVLSVNGEDCDAIYRLLNLYGFMLWTSHL